MSLISLIVSVIVVILLLLIIVFLVFYLKKYKKIAISSFNRDLDVVNKNYTIKIIDLEKLPITLEEKNKSDIYFYGRIVLAKTDNKKKIINDKNILINNANSKVKIYYHYSSFNKNKIILLNKIDFIVTKSEIQLLDPLDPVVIDVQQIKRMTFFWEKKYHGKTHDFFPSLIFYYQKKNYCFLFSNYNEMLQFIACINKISKK